MNPHGSAANEQPTLLHNHARYDASGNMTYDPATMDTYGYDADNQIISVSGGASASYTYDADGFRVEKSANGTTTVFIYSGSKDIAEYDNGAAPSSPSREFIYGNGELLAQVSGGATTYYQKDHLSVRMISDANGNVLGQEGHFPFGEAWYSASGNSEWVFTSYQHNQETGLEYAMARYYDPRTATFCSADPVEGDPSDPESWNRYVYARDNPISITDPSGKFSLFDIFKFVGLISAEIFSGGGASEAVLPALLSDFEGLGSFVEMSTTFSSAINQFSREGQQQQQSNPLPPTLQLPQKAPPAETPCKASIYVILGNPQSIGKSGAIPHGRDQHGGRIQSDSAAVDPKEFGGTTGQDLRPIADQTHGTIDMGGGKSVTFSNIRDVIGTKGITTTNPTTGVKSTVVGDPARQIIDARHPGTISVELPGLDKYPGGPHAPEVYPGTIYVPPGTPCPHPR